MTETDREKTTVSSDEVGELDWKESRGETPADLKPPVREKVEPDEQEEPEYVPEYEEPPRALYLEQWPTDSDRQDRIFYEPTGYGIDPDGTESRITVYHGPKAIQANEDGAIAAIMRQRDHTVAMLAAAAQAAGWSLGICTHRRPDDPNWPQRLKHALFIDSPVGQLSFPILTGSDPIFKHLPSYTKKHDGHDTVECNNRLREVLANVF
jgi:hypothetical protein